MTLCAACGQPGHRFGTNEGPERFDPQACINGLLGLLETAERVWWCVTHEAMDIGFNVTEGVCTLNVTGGARNECRMARRLLVDAPGFRPDIVREGRES